MPEIGYWDTAITHKGDALNAFVNDYFADPDKHTLIIGGAGFDPRSPLVATTLAKAIRGSVRIALIQEVRQESDPELKVNAEANTAEILESIPDHVIIDIDIFDPHGSVVGGRRLASQLYALDFAAYTDIVIDISALSVGISFPTIATLRHVLQSKEADYNLHVFVAHQPELDSRIRPIPSEEATTVHGFANKFALTAGTQRVATLWLPQLATGRASTLQRIHEKVQPDEVCPIIPFPSVDPRAGDELLVELLSSDDVIWQPDPRDLVYADESDPLDLYRTILRLHELRQEVFEGVGGSRVVLSPIGSKVMALGALLAAIEKELPVIYVEDYAYEIVADGSPVTDEPELMHVWLERPEPLAL
ncbi:hypothetical protein [Leifsonia sp. PS1209]|uniref:hypothetical protein n=1 Tax=Leifsonia sp. PS1209 TaxID=2724914 RepID=UPI001442D100|nr:hypothetical protein [Leifsonia sp. PS1209]QIZ99878.1 hypothetical protein HF024_16120 [Leifsonia sp. PS1209]